MNKEIKETIKKFWMVMMAVVLLANMPIMSVNAAELSVANDAVETLEAVITTADNVDNEQNPNMRTTLFNCLINILSSSDGMLVECYTDSIGTASVIGVKDIKVQKKVWYGWKTVATSTGAESENIHTFSCYILYTGAEKGETYRVSCVHYGTVDEYSEVENQTDPFVFTY